MPDQVDRYGQKVVEQGGVFNERISNATTHIIASPGHLSADQISKLEARRIAVIEPEWLDNTVSNYYEAFPTETNRPDSYLDGCSIHLGTGFDTKLVQFMKRIIRESGGMLMKNMSSLVTHHIISQEKPSDA